MSRKAIVRVAYGAIGVFGLLMESRGVSVLAVLLKRRLACVLVRELACWVKQVLHALLQFVASVELGGQH